MKSNRALSFVPMIYGIIVTSLMLLIFAIPTFLVGFFIWSPGTKKERRTDPVAINQC